jgi:hypothetical protein
MAAINRILLAAGLWEEILQRLDIIYQNRPPVYELQHPEQKKPVLPWKIARKDTVYSLSWTAHKYRLTRRQMADVPRRVFPAMMRFEQVYSIRNSSAVSLFFQLRVAQEQPRQSGQELFHPLFFSLATDFGDSHRLGSTNHSGEFIGPGLGLFAFAEPCIPPQYLSGCL